MWITAARLLAFVTALLALVAADARSADAAYPGGNGRIAFVRTITTGSSQTSSIFTATSAGGGLKQITFGHADFDPVWSPDGKRIAFVRGAWGPPSYRDIYTVAATGGAVTRVTTSAGDDLDPSWSPDGRYLIFDSSRAVTSPSGTEWLTNIYRLRSSYPYGTAMKLNTPAIACWNGQPLGQAERPSWGAGGYIAFMACDARTGALPWAIYQMKPDGTGVRELVSCPNASAECGDPDWAPLGKAISYTKLFYNEQGRSDRSVVYQYTPATNTTKRVSPSTHGWFYANAAWAPSGTQIAFDGTAGDGGGNIYVTTAAGLNFHKIITNGFEPNWQPVP